MAEIYIALVVIFFCMRAVAETLHLNIYKMTLGVILKAQQEQASEGDNRPPQIVPFFLHTWLEPR